MLQTVQGRAFLGDLRIRVIEGAEAVEVQTAPKVERRVRALKPSVISRRLAPIPSPFAPRQLFSVLVGSHACDSIETYYVVYGHGTLRLQPNPDLNHRVGFPADKRWLSLFL